MTRAERLFPNLSGTRLQNEARDQDALHPSNQPKTIALAEALNHRFGVRYAEVALQRNVTFVLGDPS